MTLRYKRPDRKNAASLVQAAKQEIEFTYSMEINEKSASTIIRNIYESFRMLGDALLVSKGIESQDHVVCIKELMKLSVKTERSIGALDNLRILRHNINYYGYRPNTAEVEDVVALSKAIFDPIYKAVIKEIETEN